ncbi:MAG: hypothetical protein EBU31_00080 [Proteobacteria bacterium]|nr:hypothetical protein [Pseudomonadota bacterium]
MSLKIELNVQGIKDLQLKFQEISERRLLSAIATGLTRTAVGARGAIRQAMQVQLDRPTPYALAGVRVITATADKRNAGVSNLPNPNDAFDGRLVESRFLEATVDLKNESTNKGTPAINFLGPNVDGRPRGLKRFELALQASGAMPKGMFAVPTDEAKLDQYGNVSRGQIQQILSQVGTELLAGSNRTLRQRRDETAKQFATRRRRAFGKAGGQYVSYPEGRGKLPPGLYLVEGRDFGARLGFGRSGRIRAVFFYQPRVSYRARFDFFGIGRSYAERNLAANIDRAIAESLQRKFDQVRAGR